MNHTKRLMIFLSAALLLAGSNAFAIEAKVSTASIKAGAAVEIKGQIDPDSDLAVVICSDKMFKASDSNGVKEKKRLSLGKNGKNAFGDTQIPATYYLITSTPDSYAAAKTADKGQTTGLFAFPPFKYKVKVNKIKKWEELSSESRKMLGPISDKKQWEYIIFTHENKFGINTIAKESAIGGGNARMILTDYNQQQEAWNDKVSLSLDKSSGKFSVSMHPYKHIPCKVVRWAGNGLQYGY